MLSMEWNNLAFSSLKKVSYDYEMVRGKYLKYWLDIFIAIAKNLFWKTGSFH